jgi:Mce-associated membrane protein
VAGHTPGRAPAAPNPAASEAAPEERRPIGKRGLRKRAPDAATPRLAATRRRRPVPLPALVGALVLLVGLAVFFAVANADVRDTPSARNTALVDIGTTAQVSQQVTAALKTVYSFDYTRLDQNEAAARAVITPAFADQFDQLFRQVRELAPQQQAVVTATVNLVGVQSIDGDTATLLVFLDQQATRAQTGGSPQQLAAAGRLTVTAQLVDGTWKIAAVDPR